MMTGIGNYCKSMVMRRLEAENFLAKVNGSGQRIILQFGNAC